MADSPGSAPTADEVFISYSTADRELLDPIVQLVRALKKNSVFQDYRSILPGERWRERLLEAVRQAKTVMVFWCEHSAGSDYVREEYEAGIASRKEMIPILLDDTKLPEPLSAYQWIDLRRPEPHAGLIRFIAPLYVRSKRHYFPKDQHGELRDWDYEHHAERVAGAKTRWDEDQALRRQSIAEAIVSGLAGVRASRDRDT
jgi:hypothetical protein